MLRAVGVLLVSRLLALAGFAIAEHREGVRISWSTMLQRWDGWWYVHLARDGYPSTLNIPGHPLYGPWGFFPTWPWTIRFTHDVLRVGYPLASGIAVTVYAVAFVLVVRVYAARLVGAAGADAAVVLICVFPGALTFSLAYTEASFLFWSTLALLCLDRRRFVPAAGAVFMACATRSTGVAVIAAALVVVIPALRRRDWSVLVPPIAGGAAFALMGWFAYSRTGDAAIWFKAEKQWDQKLDYGNKIWRAFTHTVPYGGIARAAWSVELAMAVVLLLLLILALPRWRALPMTAWVYVAVTAVAIFAYSNVGPRPRLVLALFPVLVIAAAELERRGRVWLGVAVVMLSVLTILTAYATMYSPLHVTA
jgi:hypothetical protein